MAVTDHPNVDSVRAAFQALSSSADPDEAATVLADAFHPDTVWHRLGDEARAGSRYTSRDDVVGRLLAPLPEGTYSDWSVDPVDVISAGDELVLVHVRESATVDGVARERSAALAVRVVDGQIVEGVRLRERSDDES